MIIPFTLKRGQSLIVGVYFSAIKAGIPYQDPTPNARNDRTIYVVYDAGGYIGVDRFYRLLSLSVALLIALKILARKKRINPAK